MLLKPVERKSSVLLMSHLYKFQVRIRFIRREAVLKSSQEGFFECEPEGALYHANRRDRAAAR
jgi:hypothetical protein